MRYVQTVTSLVNKHILSFGILIGIALVYFASRLYQLDVLPIFTDEAIYIRWGQIAKDDASWRFISLTDGKQPMFIWVMMVIMRFISDPLVAGRLVSVLFGFITIIGLFFLGKEVFKNTKIGLISAGLYVVYPFALVYDRIALYDTMVGTFAVWSLYLQIILIRSLRLDTVFILALAMGAGVLTKTSGFISLYLLPASLLLLPWGEKGIQPKVIRWIGLVILATILTYVYYSVLRLSPFYHIVNEKNAIFVYPIREWLQHPWLFFWGNLYVGEKNWVLLYMTWPVILLIASSFFLNKKYLREKLLLLIWFIVPLLGLALLGRVLYPRFIFFMTLPLLPLIAFTLVEMGRKIRSRYLLIGLVTLLFFMQLRADYYILTDFAHAPIPSSDKDQYNNDWPAGVGVRESVEFFEQESKKGPVFVATQGTFGLMPYALEIYLKGNKNIQIQGFWPIDQGVPVAVIEKSKKMPTYFIFYQPCSNCPNAGEAPKLWNLKVVKQIGKVTPGRYFTIYKVE